MEQRSDLRYADAGQRSRDDDVDANEPPLEVGHGSRHVRVTISLGEHDDRLGAGIPRQRQLTIDAVRAQRAVERCDRAHEIDVGGEHLAGLDRAALRSGIGATDLRPSGRNRVDAPRRVLAPGR